MSTGSYQMRSGWSDWRWNRFHISDAIPFARSIRFCWESGENPAQAWLTPVGGATGWQSLCMYYWRPDPLLTLTDSLDVGNAASESAHAYIASGSTPTGDKTYEYQGDYNAWGANPTQKSLTDNGRIISSSSEFTATILPANDGVRLMRRMEQATIQLARVIVDNQEVTESRFYTPINYQAGNGFFDTHQLFRDVEFEIPAAYTRGKSSIHIRIENMRPTANGGDWTEYFYRVYSYAGVGVTRVQPGHSPSATHAAADAGARLVQGPGGTAVALQVPEAQGNAISLSIYDMSGRLVQRLSPPPAGAGRELRCDIGNQLPAGRYVAAVRIGGYQAALPFVMAR
jgi:hypothetical protein